ncbi:MAG: helicase-exonuclease AddAB subunit AddA [Lachnospiraceae bacterium]|nr:helicase-exonuclease AddAB subunit AddA [Lachnospiraceae bacterium]
MGNHWTEEQLQAITLRNRNLLVSAAAGSGKTAVLVERIVQMLLNKAQPLDVDQLLVVTFTEAAAAEMKERIRTALERQLELEPENAHLQKQALLIYKANISTIHGFCLYVIREHFHVINLDPNFRIGEEGELRLMRQDVMDEMLEAQYATADNHAFLAFVEKFSSSRSDKKIEDKIQQLFQYAMSTPNPAQWLKKSIAKYDMEKEGIYIEETDFWKELREQVQPFLESAVYNIKQAIKIAHLPDGPYMYLPMLEADLEALLHMISLSAFAQLRAAIDAYKALRLSAKKDVTVDPAKREQVKDLRKGVKEGVLARLKKEFFFGTVEEMMDDMKSCQETAQVLQDLVLDFAARYRKRKRSKNILDFNDMEHLALSILGKKEQDGFVASSVAKEYQARFAEIMIDEYQDSNLIQESILTLVSRNVKKENNIFMVGDIKQSIYSFRLSVPELFMEKYNNYSEEESEAQKIILYRNFRSRPQVLESVNYVFHRIMKKSVGGISYDDRVALYPGADFSNVLGADSSYQSELILSDRGSVDEAEVIAWRIKELVGVSQVIDKETKILRKMRYSDIVILLRSTRGRGEVLSAYLNDAGIPVYYGSQVGYFAAYEVCVLMDYLRVIDNQRQDIPLAGVLTSPFVGLTEIELSQIKATAPQERFYKAVWNYPCGGQANGSIQEKLEKFKQDMLKYRQKLVYMGIHDLLWHIIADTDYGLYVQSMPGGNQRKANVDMLVEKAKLFETSSYKGLFHFIRYIEQLEKYEVEFGEAGISDEQSDVVRIMSIHKSKGLEFPVVMVAAMHKQFHVQDLNSNLLIHPSLGIGMNAVDLEQRTTQGTILKHVIRNQLQLEKLGEELRILYVAMTRAKEKLILIGQVKEKVLTEIEERQDYGKKGLSFLEIAGARSYLDWLLPLLKQEGQKDVLKLYVYEKEMGDYMQVVESKGEMLAKDVLLNWRETQVFDNTFKERLTTRLNFTYPYCAATGMALKCTVSELKKRMDLREETGAELLEEPEIVPLLPKFRQGEQVIGGAKRGTAYHIFLKYLDFKETYTMQKLVEVARELVKQEKMSPDMVEAIAYEEILEFLKMDVAIRMKKALGLHRLYEEQPFVVAVDATALYPDAQAGERILIQGIVDVFFVEDNELVVLDYKTDRMKNETEFKEKYKVQLDFYAYALERLTGKSVKEKIIYSFYLEKEIIL